LRFLSIEARYLSWVSALRLRSPQLKDLRVTVEYFLEDSVGLLRAWI
jgi:hypothetical protein